MTESKEKQALLYQTIYKSCPDLIFLIDADGKILDANPTAVHSFGMNLDQLKNISIRSYLNQKYQQLFDLTLHRLVNQQQSVTGLEFDISNPSGGVAHIDINASPVIEHGKVSRIVCIARDITERKKSEDELRQSEEKYRLLVEEINDVIFMLDEKGVITYISPVMARYNRQMVDVLGHSFISFVHPDDQKAVEEYFIKNPKKPLDSIEFRLQDFGHGANYVRVSSQLITEGGRVVGLRGILSDLTLSRQYELTLERRAAQLSVLNKIGEQIVSVLEPDQVFSSAASLLQKKFGYYHVAVFVPNADHSAAVMKACSGSFAKTFPSNHQLKHGQGMVGTVLAEHQTLLANDVREETTYINLYPERIPTLSELCVPILIGEELAGVIDVQSPLLKAFDHDDVQVIEAVSKQLAVAVQNARLFEEAKQRLIELERAENLMRLQRDLLAELSAVPSVPEALEKILAYAIKIEGIDSGTIYLVDLTTGALHLAAHKGMSPAFTNNAQYFESDSPTALFAKMGVPMVVRMVDLPHDPSISDDIYQKENILGVAIYPIHHENRSIAVMNLSSHTLDSIPMSVHSVMQSIAAQIGAVLARLQAEAALADSENSNRALVEALPDLLFIVNRNCQFIGYRHEDRSAMYLEPQKFMGKAVHEVMPDGMAALAEQAIRAAFATNKIQEFNYQLYLSDRQQTVYYEARISPADSDRAVVIVRDISEKMCAQLEAENRQRIYQALFEQKYDGVFIFSSQGILITVNPRGQEMLGYTLEELVGKSFHNFIVSEDIPVDDQNLEALNAGQTLAIYERKLLRKDGSTLTAEINSSLVRSPTGQTLHIQTIARDITNRKLAEQKSAHILELEKALNQISTSFHLAPTPEEWVINLLHEATSALKAERGFIFRFYDNGKLVRNTHEWVIEGIQNQQTNFQEVPVEAFPSWMQDVRNNKVVIFPAPNDKASQEIQYVQNQKVASMMVAPFFIQKELDGVIGFETLHSMRDWPGEEITFLRSLTEILGRYLERTVRNAELASTNQELQQANQRLMEVNQEESLLMANISHELRKPINSILCFSELLFNENPDLLTLMQKNYIKNIDGSSRRMLSLVNDLLDYSKIETNQMQLKRASFDPTELISEITDLVTPLINHANQSLVIQADAHLPTLTGDRLRIQQILLNLLANANKFTPAGGVITFSACKTADNLLEFCIDDTGPGIRPEDQRVIFEAFRQVENGQIHELSGAGLGLAISKRLAEMHGGRITVKSEGGQGAVFCLQLPLV